jgi:Golgi apparatus protein 1
MVVHDRMGNARGVTLSGWTALAGVAALVILVLWGYAYVFKRVRGDHSREGYTLVVKKPLQMAVR